MKAKNFLSLCAIPILMQLFMINLNNCSAMEMDTTATNIMEISSDSTTEELSPIDNNASQNKNNNIFEEIGNDSVENLYFQNNALEMKINPTEALCFRDNTPFEEERTNPEHTDSTSTDRKYMCQACGWYGYPFTTLVIDRRGYYCRSCGRGSKDLNQWPFMVLFTNSIPPQNGVCPFESKDGKGHHGFVHDTRVISHLNGTGLTASDLKRDSSVSVCCWYCYDCKRHFAVDPRKINDSLGVNRSILPICMFKAKK